MSSTGSKEKGGNMPESRKSKGKRFVAMGFLGIIIVVLMLPLSSFASAGVSGHGTAQIFEEHAAPVQGFGALPSGGYQNISVTQATVNNTTSSIIGNTYLSVGSNNTTQENYYSTVYLISNLTVSELSLHGANEYVLQIEALSGGQITLGFGNLSTAGLQFYPIANKTFASGGANFTDVNFSLTPALLNGAGYVEYEIQFSNGSRVPTYTIFALAVGSASASVTNSLMAGMSYVVSSAVLFVFGFFSLPHHDTSITQASEPIRKYVPQRKKSSGSKKLKKYKGGRR